MKKLALVTALVGALGGGVAQAATATGNFNVVINLTPSCQIAQSSTYASTAALTDITLNYTAFQSAAEQGTTGFNVKCTNTLPYTLHLDSNSYTDTTTSLAVTLGLGTVASYTSGAVSASPLAATGTGSAQAYLIGAQVAGNQAGACTAACTGTTPRTVTITY